MTVLVCLLAIAAFTAGISADSPWSDQSCVSSAVRPCVTIDAGRMCGQTRLADDGSEYASFRGVPYAEQPVGSLRFKELESVRPWQDCRHFITEGPICYQTDMFYGKIMKYSGMSEECIHANIHVPLKGLPHEGRQTVGEPGLPILVFIHGGGFAFGSGDSDFHGPEYLVSKKVIVITFNYRLNVFGFLSLNTPEVPGNGGLRDMVTLLRWVRNNARAFGGDPDNVTIGGQSAGAIAAHLLTMSKAADGLFKRAILMSGTATSSFYSPSPYFAQYMQKKLLTVLGINATDSNQIYKDLLYLPAENLYQANLLLLEQTGFTTFVPTVETLFPRQNKNEIGTILDDDPDTLLAAGRGKDIPLLVGYTNVECETFRPGLEKFDIEQKSKINPLIIIPPKLLFTTMPHQWPNVTREIDRRYYNGTISVDNFIRSCTDGFFTYPALKLMQSREVTRGASLHTYKFSYDSSDGVFKKVEGLRYNGAGHADDLTYVFKTTSVSGTELSYPPKSDDDNMKIFMTNFIVDFMTCSKPICDERQDKWPETGRHQSWYEDIQYPNKYEVSRLTPKEQEIIKFFDYLSTLE